MSSSRSGKKPSKTTVTQTTSDEDTDKGTLTHFDTSKTGRMRREEWTRKAFSRKKRVKKGGLSHDYNPTRYW